MIKAVLIFNTQGKGRLMKFFDRHYTEDEQQQVLKEIFHVVSRREDNVCNFLEGVSSLGGADCKLVYRHYATLYFVFCVDASESELGILDLIQVFVEILDKSFENVRELDLIFHSDRVQYILSELVMGGMVLETNMSDVLTRIEEQDKLEKSEQSGLATLHPSRVVYSVREINIRQKIKDFKDIKLPNMPGILGKSKSMERL